MSLDETVRTKIVPPKRQWTYDANLVRLTGISIAIYIVMRYLAGADFGSYTNDTAILSGCSELGILALAIMIAMITGGIDLSAVGIANLSSICAAMILHPAKDASPGHQAALIVGAVAVAIVVSILCGALNGILIGIVCIHPILATLGTMQLFTGIATVVTKGSAVHSFPDLFTGIGNGKIWIVPYSFIIFFLVMLGVAVFTKYRPTGKKIYFVGSNAKASRFSGISNMKTLLSTYAVGGLISGIAGLVMISRTNSAKADYGASYTMQAILVCLLAGVDPNGGKGRVAGLTIAVIALQFLSTGFNQMRASNFVRDFTWGVFLIFIILFNYFMNRLDERSRIRKLGNSGQ